jgi:hypothetical protein
MVEEGTIRQEVQVEAQKARLHVRRMESRQDQGIDRSGRLYGRQRLSW